MTEQIQSTGRPWWGSFSGTQVTDARLRGFQRALPKVDVVRGWLG